jgi:hypothetical protein
MLYASLPENITDNPDFNAKMSMRLLSMSNHPDKHITYFKVLAIDMRHPACFRFRNALRALGNI